MMQHVQLPIEMPDPVFPGPMCIVIEVLPQLISEAQLRREAMSRQRMIAEQFQHPDEIRRAFGKAGHEEPRFATECSALRIPDDEIEQRTSAPVHTEKEPDEPIRKCARYWNLPSRELLLFFRSRIHWQPVARTLLASG